MEYHEGDIQILHNHVMLHSRRGFEDWPEPERRRHLLRLWLRDDEGRVLGFLRPLGAAAALVLPGVVLVGGSPDPNASRSHGRDRSGSWRGSGWRGEGGSSGAVAGGRVGRAGEPLALARALVALLLGHPNRATRVALAACTIL